MQKSRSLEHVNMAESAAMALASGTRLEPYEVQAPVGSGGMGEVYKARDTRLGPQIVVVENWLEELKARVP
jgi:serine/threonine protein kinase